MPMYSGLMARPFPFFLLLRRFTSFPSPFRLFFHPPDNKITNMKDAGIALLETMNADIHDNVIKGAEFGIRMSLGSAGNQVYDNSFDGCTECENMILRVSHNFTIWQSLDSSYLCSRVGRRCMNVQVTHVRMKAAASRDLLHEFSSRDFRHVVRV